MLVCGAAQLRLQQLHASINFMLCLLNPVALSVVVAPQPRTRKSALNLSEPADHIRQRAMLNCNGF
jgi:hypothetical protein